MNIGKIMPYAYLIFYSRTICWNLLIAFFVLSLKVIKESSPIEIMSLPLIIKKMQCEDINVLKPN